MSLCLNGFPASRVTLFDQEHEIAPPDDQAVLPAGASNVTGSPIVGVTLILSPSISTTQASSGTFSSTIVPLAVLTLKTNAAPCDDQPEQHDGGGSPPGAQLNQSLLNSSRPGARSSLVRLRGPPPDGFPSNIVSKREASRSTSRSGPPGLKPDCVGAPGLPGSKYGCRNVLFLGRLPDGHRDRTGRWPAFASGRPAWEISGLDPPFAPQLPFLKNGARRLQATSPGV